MDQASRTLAGRVAVTKWGLKCGVSRLLAQNSSDNVIAPLTFEHFAHGVFPVREEFGNGFLRNDHAAGLFESLVEIAAL